jgi:hypothetical protein
LHCSLRLSMRRGRSFLLSLHGVCLVTTM